MVEIAAQRANAEAAHGEGQKGWIVGTFYVEKVGKFVEDKDKANALQSALKAELIAQESKFVSYQRDIIVAEAKSESYLARNWRPITMLSFVGIIVNNFMFAPYFKMFGVPYVIMDIPPDMWDLLKIGIGGYTVGRTIEKSVKSYKEK